jgi:ferrous iron transport protein B
MELPSYKMPGAWIVLQRMFEQGWAFVYRAGTLILAVSILIWALAYYPRQPAAAERSLLDQQAQLQAEAADWQAQHAAAEQLPVALSKKLAHLDGEIAGAHLENSYLGQMGHFIEPAVKPLGWDWRIGCAAIASFPARDVVVATLGVIYNLGEGQDDASPELASTLRAATWVGTSRPVFTVPVALSVMVFFALCAQCVSTLAVMRRETASWQWPIFTFVYMTTLAYFGAMATYQIGTWLMS